MISVLGVIHELGLIISVEIAAQGGDILLRITCIGISGIDAGVPSTKREVISHHERRAARIDGVGLSAWNVPPLRHANLHGEADIGHIQSNLHIVHLTSHVFPEPVREGPAPLLVGSGIAALTLRRRRDNQHVRT